MEMLQGVSDLKIYCSKFYHNNYDEYHSKKECLKYIAKRMREAYYTNLVIVGLNFNLSGPR